MKRIGKINAGTGDAKITAISNARELNNLARRAIAADEPIPIPTESGANSGVEMVARGNGIYIRYPSGEEALLTQWAGTYTSGREYYPGQDVLSDDNLAMCINTTYDSPEIFPTGAVGWAAGLGGNANPGWNLASDVLQVKYRGIQANVPAGENYAITRLAYWIPVPATDQQYALYLQERVSVDPELWNTRELLGQFAQTTVGWHYFNYTDLWRSGEAYRVLLAHISVAGESTFASTWQQINDNRTPLSGEAVWYNNNSRARFSYLDSVGVNRESQLRNVPVGARIEAGGNTWNVTGASFGVLDADFNLDGPNRLDEGTWLYRFTYGAPISIEHVLIDDYFLGQTTLRGVASNDGAPIFESDNAFGVDIELSGVDISPDWIIKSMS